MFKDLFLHNEFARTFFGIFFPCSDWNVAPELIFPASRHRLWDRNGKSKVYFQRDRCSLTPKRMNNSRNVKITSFAEGADNETLSFRLNL